MQRLSTEDVPRHERLAFVHDVVGRHAAGMCFRPVDAEAFRARFSILPLDGVLVGDACYDAFTAARTRELLADGREDYQLLINPTGYETEIDGGRTLTVGAGELLAFDQAARFVTRAPASCYEVLVLPRRTLAGLVPGLGARAFRKAGRGAAGLGLLVGYAQLLRREPPATPAAVRLAADHLAKLAALTLAADPAEHAREHGSALRNARLALIKKEIAARLDDPALDIALVARRHGISPRYVQLLFAQEDTSFSDFLREARLDRAFRQLGDATNRESVAGIAFDAGFTDLSTFNRAFRRRYGCTPSDVRARAVRTRRN
ncbi:AraC family transcriptional regulator [Ancylobacter defluvii]|uniref:AraC family transcriptional regulator n=1 Tax=Ancylobacter defluvii TaxID=1282440 RepID=A0A9W6JVC6_9HYPH|nr:AraC family transcriptional regulator [Ancylobacter defluvii]MBS7590382.1 AraC family transcriptional regulator [Ancylobacter defluvii]GLK83301.1 AraC family transcriptional regulator [Ancylobacter defluvii]